MALEPLSPIEQIRALREIASEVQRLRFLAVNAGAEMLAFQFGLVIEEVNHQLDARLTPSPPGGGWGGSDGKS